MANDKKDTTPAIDAEIRDLAKDLKKDAKVVLDDDKTKARVQFSDTIYQDRLPASVTPQVLKDLEKHNRTMYAAGALAAGELGIDEFKKHKGLQRIEASMKTGGRGDHIDFISDREKTVRDPSTGNESTVFGSMRVVLKQSSSNHKSGSLSAIRKEIAERSKKAFG